MPLIDELVQVCRKIYLNKFVTAYDGNVSVRNSPNTFLITRSGVCKGEVTADDILEIDANGTVLNGKGKVSTKINCIFTHILKDRR
jgi:L-fuculose-phosphate aldolase